MTENEIDFGEAIRPFAWAPILSLAKSDGNDLDNVP